MLKNSQLFENGENFFRNGRKRYPKQHLCSPHCPVNTVNIPELCDRMMETIKSKQGNVRFRILSKMFLETISIFTEQVQDLYRTTFNLKQDVKRHSHGITFDFSQLSESDPKSTIDFQTLLSELEKSYVTEEHFKLPDDMANKTSHAMNDITLDQGNWDNCSIFEENEEFFGDATPVELAMFLSSDDLNVGTFNGHKRKLSCTADDDLPFKRLKESIDDGRNDTIAELFETFGSNKFPGEDNNQTNQKEIVKQNGTDNEWPECLPDLTIREGPMAKRTHIEAREKSERKRKSQLIIDRDIKLSKRDMDIGIADIWRNCYDYYENEHVVDIEEVKEYKGRKAMFLNGRFQGSRLLAFFNSKLKSRSKRAYKKNQKIEILEEIFGVDAGTNTVKKPPKGNETKQPLETAIDENNNVVSMSDMNGNPPQAREEDKPPHNKVTNQLQCFPFQGYKDPPRNEWGRKGVLMKLVEAWEKYGPQVPMKALIAGVNRIKAALVFCVLLGLAAMQYIELVKSSNNSVEAVKKGPKILQKRLFQIPC